MISELKFRRLGFKIQGFRKECMAQIKLSQRFRFMNFGVDLCRFGEASEAVLPVFDVETDLEPWIWVR